MTFVSKELLHLLIVITLIRALVIVVPFIVGVFLYNDTSCGVSVKKQKEMLNLSLVRIVHSKSFTSGLVFPRVTSEKRWLPKPIVSKEEFTHP